MIMFDMQTTTQLDNHEPRRLHIVTPAPPAAFKSAREEAVRARATEASTLTAIGSSNNKHDSKLAPDKPADNDDERLHQPTDPPTDRLLAINVLARFL